MNCFDSRDFCLLLLLTQSRTRHFRGCCFVVTLYCNLILHTLVHTGCDNTHKNTREPLLLGNKQLQIEIENRATMERGTADND